MLPHFFINDFGMDFSMVISIVFYLSLRAIAWQSSHLTLIKKFLFSFEKFFYMYPLFFLFFSMRLCREKQSSELFFERERITCTPTRKKRGRLLCGVHLLTSFVYPLGLLRKSRVDFSRPEFYLVGTKYCSSLRSQ